jgi:hypothetical protein
LSLSSLLQITRNKSDSSSNGGISQLFPFEFKLTAADVIVEGLKQGQAKSTIQYGY